MLEGMKLCAKCGGFRRSAVCPHCGERSSTRFVKVLAGAFGGGAIAVTLMACYGLPPCPDSNRDCHGPRPEPPENAGDAGPDMPTAK
jgi:hypothetical protein